MNNSRLLQIIAHKSEALALEEEEYEELNVQYVREFNIDFQSELLFAQEMNLDDSSGAENVPPLIMSNTSLKKIHRKLAMITHPDRNSDESMVDEFKQIQEAFEIGDGPTLISKILHYQIDIDLEQEEISEIYRQFDIRSDRLKQKKETCAWVWHNSTKDKEPGLRARIRQSMGINETLFQNWLSLKNIKSKDG